MAGLNVQSEDFRVESMAAEYGHLGRAVRGSDDGLWEWDLLTNKVWYAPRFLELLGFTCNEFPEVLESWISRLHPEDSEATWDAIQSHLHEGKKFDVEYRLLAKNGNYRWFRARGIAYHDEKRRPICMAGSIRHIDDLKLAKQKLHEKEAQLRQQQKLDAVGSLASGIAHEFNNLLQTIRGYTQFAQEAHVPEEQAYQDLQQVLNAAQRATLLTRQLLDFSRSEEVELQPCLIDKVIQELVSMLRPLLSNGIELQLQLEALSTQVLIDAQHIQQALLNLCINAQDAMPEGGSLRVSSELVTLTETSVETTPNLHPGKYVRLTVIDTGTGISQEVLQHIFEPFYTTKEVGKGTGLGLSVTFGVIQQAGGHIQCHSELDHGTTFQIHLPVCEKMPSDPTTSLPSDVKKLCMNH